MKLILYPRPTSWALDERRGGMSHDDLQKSKCHLSICCFFISMLQVQYINAHIPCHIIFRVYVIAVRPMLLFKIGNAHFAVSILSVKGIFLPETRYC